MKLTIKAAIKQGYLPSRRHRKLRWRTIVEELPVDVAEPTEDEFPAAFLEKDWASIYEDAKSQEDFDGNGDYRLFTEEVRAYKGRFYSPLRITRGAAISLQYEGEKGASWEVRTRAWLDSPYALRGEDFTEKSIIKETDKDKVLDALNEASKEVVFFNGHFWKECGEPMWVVQTFGLGHNHGGTSLFIEHNYNPNIPASRYFNALEKEEAVAAFKKIALGRGDTESVELFESKNCHKDVQVLAPELVKRNPKEEHGAGDPFIEKLEGIAAASPDASIAGLLCAMFTAKEARNTID